MNTTNTTAAAATAAATPIPENWSDAKDTVTRLSNVLGAYGVGVVIDFDPEKNILILTDSYGQRQLVFTVSGVVIR